MNIVHLSDEEIRLITFELERVALAREKTQPEYSAKIMAVHDKVLLAALVEEPKTVSG